MNNGRWCFPLANEGSTLENPGGLETITAHHIYLPALKEAL